ncbi:MAG: DUF2231 domain-containing protein [Vicinamibacterales bacterium]
MNALFPAAMHPQVVHFTIVLAIVGVAFRLVSLVGKPAFASPAATTLLLLAAVAAFVSTSTGTAAHGPVERMPGVRAAVVEHEEAGERAEQVLLALGLVELVGLAMRRSSKVKIVRLVSAAVGLAAVVAVYEAGEHGGKLVYAYAGGVGTRLGDPKDVERLLLAGYYQQAMTDRAAGLSNEASALIGAAAARFPSDPEVALLAAESLIIDQKNPQAAVDALKPIQVPAENRILVARRATLLADAYQATGHKDLAIAELESVLESFPNPRLQRMVDELKKN